MIEREIDNPIPIPLDLVVKKGFDVDDPHHCDGLAHEFWMSGEMLREVSDAPGLEVIKGRLGPGKNRPPRSILLQSGKCSDICARSRAARRRLAYVP
jgi:hypothetical protein